MSIVDVANSQITEAIEPVDPELAYWQQVCLAANQQVQLLEQRIEQLEAELAQKSNLVNELNQQIDALKYQLVWMAQQIFGRKSEASKDEAESVEQSAETPSSSKARTNNPATSNPATPMDVKSEASAKDPKALVANGEKISPLKKSSTIWTMRISFVRAAACLSIPCRLPRTANRSTGKSKSSGTFTVADATHRRAPARRYPALSPPLR